MIFDYVPTIRYMGTKSKLLNFIIPQILRITPENGSVADIMAGSMAVSYALKKHRKLIVNDVQYYSKIIGIGIIENQVENISEIAALSDIVPAYIKNLRDKSFKFFLDNYANTYFSTQQCLDIDSIRYAISKINSNYKKSLYLCALMGAMCKVQSSPGHFAQYMPASNPRIQKLQNMSLYDEFLDKCNLYSNIVMSNFKNSVYCLDYHDLINQHLIDNVSTVYLDSPYTQEQYSRFYHVLETIVKYDYPITSFKAKYREDRFMSKFCYKSTVSDEFAFIFSFCSKQKINLVVSYSDKGVISLKELSNLAHSYFSSVEINYHKYEHSTQGKGNTAVHEVVIICIP